MTLGLLVLIAILVFADQLTAFFVFNHLRPVDSYDFIPGVLNFHYVENTGAAFGIFSQRPTLLTIFNILILVIGLLFLLIKSRELKTKGRTAEVFAFAMVIAGGAGNVIDRLIRGFVIDYMELAFIDFPVFNLADSFITIGVTIVVIKLLVDIIRDMKKEKKNDRA